MIEKSLSVDNVFVLPFVFSTLAVPAAYQHRMLFWGIPGGFPILTGLKFLRGQKTAPSLTASLPRPESAKYAGEELGEST